MKLLKYLPKICLAVCMACMVISCNNSAENKQVIETLMKENEKNVKLLQEYQNAVALLNETVDSIASQENMIFVANGEEALTKDDVMQNLDRFETVLRHQQDKISKLERLVRLNNDSNSQTLRLIENLKSEIDNKNRQIAHLQEELKNKNLDIESLQNTVSQQQTTISSQLARIEELDKRNQKQGEALARQDAMLNNGYVLIGSKDDLKRKGITKKGKLVADAALDRTKFAKVDIRNWREISFTAKKPVILTNMPSSSYSLVNNGDRNYTLVISNPSDFWRISNYLVIQTD